MGKLYFVPGLQGHLNVGRDIPNTNSNRAATERAAVHLGWDFQNVAYQTADRPFPRLSRMGSTFAIECMKTEGESLCVASSVGFGVVMQSLRNFFAVACQPPHIIGVMGIPDPLTAIELQVQHTAPETLPLLNKVKEGNADEFRLPVIKSDVGPEPGDFLLEERHFSDPDALRLIADPQARTYLTSYFDTPSIVKHHVNAIKIPSMLLITSPQDPFYKMSLALKTLAQAWVATPIQLVEWAGTHGANRAQQLEDTVVAQAQELGL